MTQPDERAYDAGDGTEVSVDTKESISRSSFYHDHIRGYGSSNRPTVEDNIGEEEDDSWLDEGD